MVAALVVLAIVIVCGGSSLAVLSGLFGPTAATDLRFPVGNGLTGAGGTDTPGSSGSGSGGGGNTTGQATLPPGLNPPPGSTATAGTTPGTTPLPGSTATPTTTNPPQPTATAVPPSLTVANVSISTAGGQTCLGVQLIRNQSGSAFIGWQWNSNPWGKDASFQLNGNSTPPPPSHWSPGIEPGNTDEVIITVDNCSKHLGTTSIMVTDTTGATYTFQATVG
jgi:hypothetical protein